MAKEIDTNIAREKDTIKGVLPAHSLKGTLREFREMIPNEAYVAQRRAAQREKNKPLLDLLAQWRQEEAAMSDEEKDKATQELNELLANLQANRTRIGHETAS